MAYLWQTGLQYIKGNVMMAKLTANILQNILLWTSWPATSQRENLRHCALNQLAYMSRPNDQNILS